MVGIPFYISTQSLVIVSGSFTMFLDYTKVMDEMHHECHKSHGKRPRFQGKFGGSHSGSKF